jgi:hypothetical protein
MTGRLYTRVPHHFNAEPDPAPHQGAANLRQMAERLSTPPF